MSLESCDTGSSLACPWREFTNRSVRYEQLVLQASSLREELHTATDRVLNDVIKFKIHIQQSLDEYEGLVADEVEQQLGGDYDRMNEDE